MLTRSMNAPKCDEMDYINFLIAAQRVFSSVEASLTHPAEERAPTHDAYTRLQLRKPYLTFAQSTVLFQLASHEKVVHRCR